MRNLLAWIVAASCFVTFETHPFASTPDPPHFVFFNSGTTQPWNLDQFNRVLTDFVSTYWRVKPLQVRVVGHADTAEANVALSVARAEMVKSRLIELGIPADRIAVVGRGDASPLVITPPGTAEPQNRRVEITWR